MAIACGTHYFLSLKSGLFHPYVGASANCPSIEGFTFYPGTDSSPSDIAPWRYFGRTSIELAELCMDVGCKAFLTTGLVKMVLPQRPWQGMLGQANECDGMYVRSGAIFDGEEGGL